MPHRLPAFIIGSACVNGPSVPLLAGHINPVIAAAARRFSQRLRSGGAFGPTFTPIIPSGLSTIDILSAAKNRPLADLLAGQIVEVGAAAACRLSALQHRAKNNFFGPAFTGAMPPGCVVPV